MNDGDSSVIGQSVSPISAAMDSTVEHNFVINKNHRMRDELKNISRYSRRQHVKGKNARRRHNKMST